MQHVADLCLVLAALIHALPLLGVLGGARLTRLYGVNVDDPNIALALRHRAVLFGLLAVALFGGAVVEAWRLPAAVAGLVSATSFVVLAWLGRPVNAAMRRVVVVDVVAIAALLVVLAEGLVDGR